MDRNGNFWHVTEEVFNGIYWGKIENKVPNVCDSERWKSDTGKHWSYWFTGNEFNTPELDLILPDSLYARVYSFVLKLKRKIKAFNNQV